jgi:hypothetical protein
MPSRVDPIEKDIDLLIRQDLSPEAQSRVLAEFALDTLAEAEAKNAEVLGHPVRHETFVDGREGAAEETVRPSGTIVYEFELVEEIFAWIDEQLLSHSPVGGSGDRHSGLYRRSHIFYADDEEADPLAPPPGIRIGTFVNAVPYARKIEEGESPQQPDGVYEVVTHLAARRFGNIAKIVFAYRGVVEGQSIVPAAKRSAVARAQNKSAVRYPAIVVTVR